jgi:hypothetical protein
MLRNIRNISQTLRVLLLLLVVVAALLLALRLLPQQRRRVGKPSSKAAKVGWQQTCRAQHQST